MHFLVACTIKSKSKNQSGIFRVGLIFKKDNYPFFWEKIAGEYDFVVQGKVFSEGSWMEHGSKYINPGSTKRPVPYESTTASPDNKLMIYTKFEPNVPYTSIREHLATLENCPVSDIFQKVHLEKQTIRGEGTTALTNEELEWSMWYKETI